MIFFGALIVSSLLVSVYMESLRPEPIVSDDRSKEEFKKTYAEIQELKKKLIEARLRLDGDGRKATYPCFCGTGVKGERGSPGVVGLNGSNGLPGRKGAPGDSALVNHRNEFVVYGPQGDKGLRGLKGRECSQQ